MAYNKTKHLDAAQKYLQQGKLPQAIAEYQQILKHEPKDQVTLMTLGDMYVRQGETFQALEYFERLAKIFLADGFTTKAIAIYKKVAKLAPEESRPLEKLAELYVQQGVLSEARPIYLQLAEGHLKAGRQPQAAVLLRKLLEAEPDNQRVQTKLAELCLSIGEQKEAVEILHNAAQKAIERGDHAEALRLAERILQLDPNHQATFLLKIRALSASGKSAEASKLLETMPDQDAGGETTLLLLEQYAEGGEPEKAAALAERVFAKDPAQYGIAHRIASALLDAGEIDRAQVLLGLIRDQMINSGDHEMLAQSLNRLVEQRPGQLQPLEWLVDLYGRASDSFRLPDALAQLAHAYETSGHEQLALATYEQLIERTPEDETTRRKYVRLRKKSGLAPISGDIAPPIKVAPEEPSAAPSGIPVAVAAGGERALDEETQRYVTQALTDVDLFSSYGLTQKAMDLLESVLDRAPEHTPVLERLLDLSVASGNDRRTVELARALEQISLDRHDRSAMERYAEIRRRYQKAAGAPQEQSHTTPAPAYTPPAQEFSVPMIEAELDEPVAEPPGSSAPAPSMGIPLPAESAVHEVDLSGEWASLSLEDLNPVVDPVAVPEPAHEPHQEVPHQEETLIEAEEVPAFDLELLPIPPAAEETGGGLSADALLAELANEFESVASSMSLSEEPAKSAAPPQPQTAAPIQQTSAPTAVPLERAASVPVVPGPPKAPERPPVAAAPVVPVASSVETPEPSSPKSAAAPPKSAPAPAAKTAAPANRAPSAPAAGGSNALNELFEEFRSEMGEANKDDEDLETHYNLGIAYREMGLLEEAISEFQKVASKASDGQTFRYSMQCSTLLGLAFMDKGQPAIAAIWYERALKTPGLDQDSILALRYDLGVAQEMAGDTGAAFRTFSQVYAVNIDYRDVSDRIALLSKAR